MTEDVRIRVAEFAAEHGRTWKAKLRELWLQGDDEGNLRNARNMIGPRRLDHVTPSMLKMAILAKLAKKAMVEAEEKRKAGA